MVLTILIGEKINKFFGLLGSFTCTPIAFTFPAMFHLKACAKTKFWKWVDWTIIVMSLGFLAFTLPMLILLLDAKDAEARFCAIYFDKDIEFIKEIKNHKDFTVLSSNDRA